MDGTITAGCSCWQRADPAGPSSSAESEKRQRWRRPTTTTTWSSTPASTVPNRKLIGSSPCSCPRSISPPYWPRRSRPPLPAPSLSLAILLLLSLLPAPGVLANKRPNDNIEVDWTLHREEQRTISSSPSSLRHPGSSPSPIGHPLSRQHVLTKFVRLKDVLRFRCPPNMPLAIHMVSAESALLCRLPAEQRERDRALIGYCGPHTSDPRLIIREYSPLPGKPTFRPGQSYFFISTSDGTGDGVRAASGGFCRSNALRLRIVVMPSSVTGDAPDSRSASVPADEITDLAELLFKPTVPQQAPHPSPSGSDPGMSHHSVRPHAVPHTSGNSPADLGPPALSVFPAILTLEERNGNRRQVLVHSPTELAAQIDSANRRSGGTGLELSVHQQQQRQENVSEDDREMPRYEVSNNSDGDDEQQSNLNRWHGRGSNAQRHHQAETQRPPKSVRSPEPAEPQKLIYIIGYGDGHEASSARIPTRSESVMMLCLIFLLITLLLLI